MNEESKEASGDKKYSGEKSVEPGVRSIEEQIDKLENQFQGNTYEQYLSAKNAKILVQNMTNLVSSIQLNFSELKKDSNSNKGKLRIPESASRRSNVKSKMQLSLLKRQFQRDYERKVKCLIQN